MSLLSAEDAYKKTEENRNKISIEASIMLEKHIEERITDCINNGRTTCNVYIEANVSENTLKNIVNKLQDLHYNVWIDYYLSSSIRNLHIDFTPQKGVFGKRRIFPKIFGE